MRIIHASYQSLMQIHRMLDAHTHHYMTSQPRTPWHESSSLWKPQMSHNFRPRPLPTHLNAVLNFWMRGAYPPLPLVFLWRRIWISTTITVTLLITCYTRV